MSRTGNSTTIPADDDSGPLSLEIYSDCLFLTQDTADGDECIELTPAQARTLCEQINTWLED